MEKLEFNKEFFKIIDDEYKAYTLGYLYANGSVYEPKGQVLFSGDVVTLGNIREALGSNHRIIERGRTNRFVIYSKELVEDLQALGLDTYKCETLSYPTFLSKDLERHFIRGFFEGKGSYMIEKESKKLATNIACGSHRFLEGLRDALVSMGMPRANIHKYGSRKLTSMIRFYKHDTHKLHRLLYEGARIYSSRHKARYLYGVSCTDLQ